MDQLEYLRNRTVLITGAAGTIGTALSTKLAPVVQALRCYDHAETELFFLHQRLVGKGSVSPQLGDVRDLDRLRFAMRGVDVVFHAAALKHIGLGEYNPFEVVQTNLQGLNNLIRAALDENVQRVVFTSSDKAVNPTNVMGASKMMGERLVIAANEIRGRRHTRFSAVRFGNVIGSRGSVVPIFAAQLLQRSPLTLTHESMTRYVMTIREAAELVLEAGSRMLGGEVFVTKMRALRVVDLAKAMADALGTGKFDVVNTGPRPGEKMYEELLADEETDCAVDFDRLLVVLPAAEASVDLAALRSSYAAGQRVSKTWNSSKDTLMSVAEIASYLKENEILAPYLQPWGSIYVKVLVTGGAGFIGRWVVRKLLDDGHQVMALDDLSNGRHENVSEFEGNPGWLALVVGDIKNVRVLADVFGSTEWEAIFHLGASIHVQKSIDDPEPTFRNDAEGTFRILEAARAQYFRLNGIDVKSKAFDYAAQLPRLKERRPRVVCMSTCMVYDLAGNAPISESHGYRPSSPYAASKIASDMLALSYYHSYRLPVTVVRPFNTYGPFQKSNSEGGVVSIFLKRDLAGEPLLVKGEGTQTRDLLYVEDCADFVTKAAWSEDAEGHILNAGTGTDVSVNELARMCCGPKNRIERVPHDHPQAEIARLVCDASKAERVLGWKARTPLAEGLATTRNWLNENRWAW